MKKIYVLFAMIALFSLSSFSLKFKDETSKLKEFGTIVKSDAKNTGFKELVNEMPIKPQKKAVKGIKRNNLGMLPGFNTTKNYGKRIS